MNLQLLLNGKPARLIRKSLTGETEYHLYSSGLHHITIKIRKLPLVNTVIVEEVPSNTKLTIKVNGKQATITETDIPVIFRAPAPERIHEYFKYLQSKRTRSTPSSLYYAYPVHAPHMSFSIIARHHLKYVPANPVGELDLERLDWKHKALLIHPFFYPLLWHSYREIPLRLDRFEKVAEAAKLGGFEVADTDRISETAAEAANLADLIFVPSTWAKKAFQNGGVKTKVEVLPHGIPEAFITKDRQITDPQISWLLKLKEKGKKLILYFLTHSGYRKGADILYEAMRQVLRLRPEAQLVVKRLEILDPMLGKLKRLGAVEIPSWLNDHQLRQLYDACDLLVCPSRGGGFELNALEALARGLPTIVPNGGCFTDYIQYAIPAKVAGFKPLWSDNPIHVGNGIETDPSDLAKKIVETLDDLEERKAKAWENAPEIWQHYNWKRIGETLNRKLHDYGFIGGERQVKINLGSGEGKLPGYVNVDIRPEVNPDILWDLEKLPWPFKTESADEILARDIIEHLSWRVVEDALKECYRILKHGGKLIIQTPDMEAIARKVILNPNYEYMGLKGWKAISFWVYGRQDPWGGFHKSGFTILELWRLLEETGFRVEKIENDGGTNIVAVAVKP